MYSLFRGDTKVFLLKIIRCIKTDRMGIIMRRKGKGSRRHRRMSRKGKKKAGGNFHGLL